MVEDQKQIWAQGQYQKEDLEKLLETHEGEDPVVALRKRIQAMRERYIIGEYDQLVYERELKRVEKERHATTKLQLLARISSMLEQPLLYHIGVTVEPQLRGKLEQAIRAGEEAIKDYFKMREQ